MTVLNAFYSLQMEPGLARKMIHFATSYQQWAQGGIPNYRKMVSRVSNSSGDLQSYGFGLQQGQCHIVSSPVSSLAPDTPHCSPGLSPVTSRPIFHYDSGFQSMCSPLTGLDSSSISQYGKTASGDDYGFSDGIPSLLFSSRSNSTTLMDSDVNACALPLPPLGVLLTWHAHLMRPDDYAMALEGDYKELRGVPFPLKEAVSSRFP
jgi:hypothetical protein